MAKSSKSSSSSRQKLIDDAMKKQRGAEKRRGFAIVGVCILVAIVLIGAAAYRPIKDSIDKRRYADVALSDLGAAASVCQDVVTRNATGVSDHVPTDTPVTYEDAPPAFGAHWNEAGVAPAPFDNKFYDKDDRPALESLVHNLEHGYTILWYDETAADNAGWMTQLRAIAEKFDASGESENFRLKFIIAPWLESDEDGKPFPDDQHIAFTHWAGDAEKSTGVWQYCSEPSGAALETFMADWPYTDAPESAAI